MKNIMTRAHAIKNEAATKFNCKPSEIIFSICLEMAWGECLDTTNEDDVIKKGSLWERHGKRRVYFNNIEKWLEIECNRYKTGNISSASMNGVGVSNSQAKKAISNIYGEKVFYNLDSKKFCCTPGLRDDLFEIIVTNIKKQ